MNKNNYCVIMAGGIGSRFWPLSTTKYPKQFLDILGMGKTLLQQTFERFAKICPEENIIIVSNSDYKDIIIQQLPQIKEENILLEPLRKNTAPCIAYANYKIFKKNPEAIIVVAPSDHLVAKEDRFLQTIQQAFNFAKENEVLITIGIKPSFPHTGYGYIQIDENKKEEITKVKTFIEKPNYETAKFFFESKEFFWNSGIFIWSLKSIMQAFEHNLPEVDNLFKEGTDYYNTANEVNFIKKTYPQSPNISIDYGVMEKANNVFLIKGDFGWSDLGNWSSIYENSAKENGSNAVIGENIMIYDSTNTLINNNTERLVVAQGLDDYIVVETEKATLICKKSEEQKIKEIVNDIKEKRGEEYI